MVSDPEVLLAPAETEIEIKCCPEGVDSELFSISVSTAEKVEGRRAAYEEHNAPHPEKD